MLEHHLDLLDIEPHGLVEENHPEDSVEDYKAGEEGGRWDDDSSHTHNSFTPNCKIQCLCQCLIFYVQYSILNGHYSMLNVQC